MRIRYIHPLYDFDAGITHVAVPEIGLNSLRGMAQNLVGTNDLAAIYIPEGTSEAYSERNKHGRVVGTASLLPMPPGHSESDYYYDDPIETVRRWPFGWPCKAVHSPPIEQCPYLRGLVERIHGPDFRPYVARFQFGPFELDRRMSDTLAEYFPL